MTERAAKKLERRWLDHEEALKQKAISACCVTPEGRALLWWLLSITNSDAQPFAGDPYATAFNCGQVNIGLQLKAAIIDNDPEGYVKLLQEKARERTERTRQLDALKHADTGHDPYTEHDPDE